MVAYIYQAALYCEDCGEKIRETLDAEGSAPEDPDDESSYDSDDYPKGPYADGGGEADSPQHCDDCGEFLENPLTADGMTYVRERCAGGNGKCVKQWSEFYNVNRIDPAVHQRVGATTGEALPSFTSIGSYTLVYYAKDGSEFCAKCANESDTSDHITDADIYWEGPSLNCSHCDCVIESSYGDPDAD